VYCQDHVPAQTAAAADPSPYTSPQAPPPVVPDAGASPGLAFLLGLIPGVGAIYNGQYVKGLVHVVILGILISIVSSGEAAGGLEPLFGMMIGVWVFYMAFEAYHTAKKRQIGQSVDEFSSLVPLRGGQTTHFPVAPAVLIAVGLLFLLHNMDIIRISQLLRYWPIALIALGAYMLYERVSPSIPRHGSGQNGMQEARHERQ
jgi:TM2 domain-containing membrane protein YozV